MFYLDDIFNFERLKSHFKQEDKWVLMDSNCYVLEIDVSCANIFNEYNVTIINRNLSITNSVYDNSSESLCTCEFKTKLPRDYDGNGVNVRLINDKLVISCYKKIN